MEINVSLDRVTVSGKVIDYAVFLDHVRDFGWSIHDDNDRLYASLERHFDNGDSENVAVLMPNPYQENSWRIDTSNHLDNLELKKVLRVSNLIAGLHFTRCDIAFDFINGDVEAMKHIIVRSRATQAEFRTIDEARYFGAMGNLETLYSGKRSSDKMIRLYNKLIERRSHRAVVPDNVQRWERWELQLRGKKTADWFNSACEMLDEIKLPQLENLGLKASEKAMLHALADRTIDFSELAPASKSKYRKLMKSSSGFDTHYADEAVLVLDRNKDKIQNEIDMFLGNFEEGK